MKNNDVCSISYFAPGTTPYRSESFENELCKIEEEIDLLLSREEYNMKTCGKFDIIRLEFALRDYIEKNNKSNKNIQLWFDSIVHVDLDNVTDCLDNPDISYFYKNSIMDFVLHVRPITKNMKLHIFGLIAFEVGAPFMIIGPVNF